LIIDAREWDNKKGLNEDDIFYFRDLGLNFHRFLFIFEGGLISLIKFYNKFQKTDQSNIFMLKKNWMAWVWRLLSNIVDDIVDRIFLLPIISTLLKEERM